MITEKIPLSEMRMFTYRQLAELLQCSEKTIYNFVQRGDLVPFRCGGLVRFPEENVKEFLKNNSEAKDLQLDPSLN
jgi:excisionase family DNA binding protein